MRPVVLLLAFLVVFPLESLLISTPAEAVVVPDLRDRLEKDLRARLPSQFQFIDRVIEAIQDERLPLGMVESVYLWARRQPRHRFQHFESGLRIRARRIGVQI